MYFHFFKRVIDFILVFYVLALIWPILLLVALWLHFANKGTGAFFTQERPGKNGKIFKVIKFKTMSLVGPRPHMLKHTEEYSQLVDKYMMRHLVKPGITGWAQVNGRNAISWTRKFELDVWYVNHCSFLLDLKIIFMTIKKVFVREGISSETSVTMEAFTGNN